MTPLLKVLMFFLSNLVDLSTLTIYLYVLDYGHHLNEQFEVKLEKIKKRAKNIKNINIIRLCTGSIHK